MKNKIAPKSRDENLLVQELGDETLVYDLIANRAFCLNESSKLIWQECDGTKSVDEIAANVSRKLNDKVSNDFIWLALDQLNDEKLLIEESVTPSGLTGMTRREAVKRVGLASMLALPVVTALAAPTAAQTASTCLGEGVACTSSAQCCDRDPIGDPNNYKECYAVGPGGTLICSTTPS